MSLDPVEARHERSLLRTATGGVLILVLGVVVLLMIRALVRDADRRDAAIRRFGQAWGGVEGVADRATSGFRSRRQRIEREVSAQASRRWAGSDDVMFRRIGRRIQPIPASFYAHGAFMGAAPAMLSDAKWRRILAFLMPDVFQDVRRHVGKGAKVSGLIPMFENNPVMCAFGVHRLGTRAPSAIEWDLFLDSERADRWSATAEESERQALVVEIVDNAVVAHASSTDTLQEAMGICQWGDVRRTAKSRLGGVTPVAWLDLFARSMRLAEADDLDAAIGQMAQAPRHQGQIACLEHTFREPLPMSSVSEAMSRSTGRPHLSIMLEIKSVRSTPALLAAIVQELARRGVHVAGVGSFRYDEIRGVSRIAQRVGDLDLPGPRELLFFHVAGDVQRACEAGLIPPGVAVLFNGASLLDVVTAHGQREYAVREDVIDGLDALRQAHELSMGVYVQEDDCDAHAAELLGEIVAQHPATFDVGFVWGGLPDEVALAEGATEHRGFGPQRMLTRVGYAKDWAPRATRDGTRHTR